MKNLALVLITVVSLTGCSQAVTPTNLPESVQVGPSSSDSGQTSSTENANESSIPQQSAEPDVSEPSEESQSGSPTSANEYVIDYAELEIEDQSGDGTTIAVDEVRTSLASGLIVITNRSGSVLGVAKVSANSTPVSISLSTPITSSQELYAQLFSDNGNGAYDSSDLVVYESLEDREPITEDFDYVVR